MSQWTVYMLRCADSTFYIGITKDLCLRVKAHNRGVGAKYTRGRGPVQVVWQEDGFTEGEARKREYALKKLKRSAKEALIA